VVLAKEKIRSRKAVSKLSASKAHMNSVLMGVRNQLAARRVAGSLQKSTEVMKATQSLVKIPEIQATLREPSKEMMMAGITEMLEEAWMIKKWEKQQRWTLAESSEEGEEERYALTAGHTQKLGLPSWLSQLSGVLL
jgi:charged multivesicular body protein 3